LPVYPPPKKRKISASEGDVPERMAGAVPLHPPGALDQTPL